MSVKEREAPIRSPLTLEGRRSREDDVRDV